MRAWCAEHSSAEAIAALEAAGLPAGPVYTPQQALDDPQAAAMGIFRQIDDYPGLPRPATVPDLPVTFSRSPAGISRRPPTLGEHTDDILSSLGYDAGAVEGLRARGVV
jgi:crotonobetainyl-CoA:carnitine CoA-transferase CaiB-like acyl-CoA transferase